MRIIKFGKDGCAPCSTVSHLLQTWAVNYEEFDIMLAENVDDIIKYNIKNVPTTMLVDENGEVVKKVIGANVEQLKDLVEYGS